MRVDRIGMPAASVTATEVKAAIASADASLVTVLAKFLCEWNIDLSPVMT
jgi:hypothetical protein